jgi:hypothetical protein
MSLVLSRRALLLGATATLAGCDRLAQHESVRRFSLLRISTNGRNVA